jgi:hypothetical protein
MSYEPGRKFTDRNNKVLSQYSSNIVENILFWKNCALVSIGFLCNQFRQPNQGFIQQFQTKKRIVFTSLKPVPPFFFCSSHFMSIMSSGCVTVLLAQNVRGNCIFSSHMAPWRNSVCYCNNQFSYFEQDEKDQHFLNWLKSNGAKFDKIDWPSSKTVRLVFIISSSRSCVT